MALYSDSIEYELSFLQVTYHCSFRNCGGTLFNVKEIEITLIAPESKVTQNEEKESFVLNDLVLQFSSLVVHCCENSRRPRSFRQPFHQSNSVSNLYRPRNDRLRFQHDIHVSLLIYELTRIFRR